MLPENGKYRRPNRTLKVLGSLILSSLLLGMLILAFQNSSTVAQAATALQAPPNKAAWGNPVLVGPGVNRQPLWQAAMRVRPGDGVAFMLGESGSSSGPGYGPGSLLLATSNSPGQLFNINDAGDNGKKNQRLSFAPDGRAFVVWRHGPPDNGYRAYLRAMAANGTWQPGLDLGRLYQTQSGGAELDQPDVAYSVSNNKLYLTGQIQTNPPGWGFAESSSNGSSWSGFTSLATGRPPTGDIVPRVCVDGKDNVHVAGLWNAGVAVRSRINGQWGAFTVLTTETSTWSYRGGPKITCGEDGYVYVVWDGPGSVGLARYTPGGSWQVITQDVAPGYNAGDGAVTTSADGQVWVAMGVNDGPQIGTLVAASSDRGTTFPIAARQMVIPHIAANSDVDINYAAGRLYVIGNFKEPGPRETFFSSANLTPAAPPPTNTARVTVTVAPPTTPRPTFTARPTLTPRPIVSLPATQTPTAGTTSAPPTATNRPITSPATTTSPSPSVGVSLPQSCEQLVASWVETLNALYRVLGRPLITARQLCEALSRGLPNGVPTQPPSPGPRQTPGPTIPNTTTVAATATARATVTTRPPSRPPITTMAPTTTAIARTTVVNVTATPLPATSIPRSPTPQVSVTVPPVEQPKPSTSCEELVKPLLAIVNMVNRLVGLPEVTPRQLCQTLPN